jgi:hypothetical protein
MNKPERTFQWHNGSGRAVTAGDVTVTPQSQALVIRWPNGGLVWNRPVAVVVESPGQTRRIPIRDITRIVQISLFAISVASWIGFLLLRRRRTTDLR